MSVMARRLTRVGVLALELEADARADHGEVAPSEDGAMLQQSMPTTNMSASSMTLYQHGAMSAGWWLNTIVTSVHEA